MFFPLSFIIGGFIQIFEPSETQSAQRKFVMLLTCKTETTKRLFLVLEHVCVWRGFITKNLGGHPSENKCHWPMLALRTRFVTEYNHGTTPGHQ